MRNSFLALTLVATLLSNCTSPATQSATEQGSGYADVSIVSEMKNVMWKGELGSSIDLDTISNKKGLYGLGPVTYLTGELLINNGTSYVSSVLADSTMVVEKQFEVSAPFFVYTNVTEWVEEELPTSVKTIQDLEKYIDDKTKDSKRPFAFKVIGEVASAKIHIQNLPLGTRVSSPKEAHQGQVNYDLGKEAVEVIGFFSTEHQGVFTHHDSYLHMHLITQDESKMGHLDEVEFGEMKLYLPKA